MEKTNKLKTKTEKQNFLKVMLMGMVLGLGNILPGVSGAALAMSFGIYGHIIEVVNIFFDEIEEFFKPKKEENKELGFLKRVWKTFLKLLKDNMNFAIPLVVGMLLGIVLTAGLIAKALENYETEFFVIFAGIVLATIPSVIREAKGNGDPELKDQRINRTTRNNIISFAILIVSIGFVLALTLYGETSIENSSMMFENNIQTYIELAVLGVLAAIAAIVPGISGSVIFMVLGKYQAVINMVKNPFSNLIKIGFFAIGILFGLVATARALQKLMEKYKFNTYVAIVGFIVGSLLAILYQQLFMVDMETIKRFQFIGLFLMSGAVGLFIDQHSIIVKKAKAVKEREDKKES